MIHAVHADTHALVTCHHGTDPNGPPNGGHGAPAAADAAEGENDGDDECAKDASKTEASRKGYPHGITVADRPSDEIGMVLVMKRVLDSLEDPVQGSGMGGVRESMYHGFPISAGKVELPRRTIHYVRGDNTVNLFSIRLDGDYKIDVSIGYEGELTRLLTWSLGTSRIKRFTRLGTIGECV